MVLMEQNGASSVPAGARVGGAGLAAHRARRAHHETHDAAQERSRVDSAPDLIARGGLVLKPILRRFGAWRVRASIAFERELRRAPHQLLDKGRTHACRSLDDVLQGV